MEVFSLECITDEIEILVIQKSKENQPRLTKRWSTVYNLAKTGDDQITPTARMQEQQSHQALTENAKKTFKQEMELMEKGIFKPLEFNRKKSNGKKTNTKCPTFDRVFVIRF